MVGKRKKSKRPIKFSQGKVSEGVGSAYNDGFECLVDTSAPDYVYDAVDRYHEDITSRQMSQAMGRMRHIKAKKENVLSLGMDSSDEEQEDEEAEPEEESDESSEDEGLLPFLETDDIVEERPEKELDERAWGKDKSLYYGTNVTDQHVKKRAQNLHITKVHDVMTLELEAHRSHQRNMSERLVGLESVLDWCSDDAEDEEKAVPKAGHITIVPEDIDNLSKAEKLKILNKLSPEFIPLTDDMLSKAKTCEELLEPILFAVADGKLGPCKALEYVQLKYRIIKCYCLVVLGYVMLVSAVGHTAIKTHPVMDKILRYRMLFKKLERADDIMKPQLERLVHSLQNNIPLDLLHPPKQVDEKKYTAAGRLIKSSKQKESGSKAKQQKEVISKTKQKEEPTSSKRKKPSEESSSLPQPVVKKVKFPPAVEESDSDSSGDNEEDAKSAAAPSTELEEDERRHIGKTITKNRGLTPRRKKALRNPRIKYKTKYGEKLKRRKGQVRPVQREVKLYSGEKSGINAHVIKSVKLK